MLRYIVRTLYIADHETLLSPATWRQHSDLIVTICGSVSEPIRLADLRERSERMSYKLVVSDRSTSPRRNQMEEISVSLHDSPMNDKEFPTLTTQLRNWIPSLQRPT